MSAKEHTLTPEMLKDLDALYEDAEDVTLRMPWHRHWGSLVEELRAIRRLVEAGVVVKIASTE